MGGPSSTPGRMWQWMSIIASELSRAASTLTLVTPRPSVSLLLPNRNNVRILDLTLGRLAEHTDYPNWELVVIDDDSSDGSRELLRRWRDSGRIESFTLLEREHSGVASSLNAGLA